MGVAEYVRALLASDKLGPQVRHHRCEPARAAVYAESRLPWPAAIRRTLEERGLSGLYSHQALATDHIRAGHSVVVATPTASGKSLIYNLPVLERHLRDSEARALYLFPLKALAQDQLAGLQRLVSGWPEEARPTAALYDGDTSDHFRRKIRRDPPTVLISNPEMLHLALLPHHEQWAPFLAGLSHIVVDEAHTYRGVFGAHMAGVFEKALTMDWVETVMFPYNIVETQGEALMQKCREQNVGFICMKPMAGGALEDARLAMRFIGRNENVSVVIPGMYDVREIDQNIEAIEDASPLNEAERAQLDVIRRELGTQFCRRCNYCQPCTAGIAISGIFVLEGYLNRYGLGDWAKQRYAAMGKKAGDCVGCGACEKRCPYQLPIRQMLARCKDEFGA